MTQSSFQQSLADKLHHIADIIAGMEQATCIRCGDELHYPFIVNQLINKEDVELIEMKGSEGLLCCKCYGAATYPRAFAQDTHDSACPTQHILLSSCNEPEFSYVMGVSNLIGANPEDVANSTAFKNWSKKSREFKQNPVRYYKRSIEDKERKIKKYEDRIKRHEILIAHSNDSTDIKRRRELIEKYLKRIEKNKKSIKWLNFLIELNGDKEKKSD